MSVAPVLHPSAAQPAPGSAAGRRPLLRIVPPPARKAPRAPFIVLVCLVLGGGLIALLLINTQRAQDAFTMARLQRANALLQDQEQALAQVVQRDQDPTTLAGRARALGMVPDNTPTFIGDGGKVLGAVPPGAPVPGPQSQDQGGVLVALPAPAAPAPPPAAATPAPRPAPAPTPPPAVRTPPHRAVPSTPAVPVPSPTPTATRPKAVTTVVR